MGIKAYASKTKAGADRIINAIKKRGNTARLSPFKVDGKYVVLEKVKRKRRK